MNRMQTVAAVAALLLAAAPAAAQDFKSHGIVVEQPWSRATPKGAPVAGGYMVVHNNGTKEDHLIGGTFADAKTVQVHEMTMQNGIMKMRELPHGLAIPPGGTVKLDPTGYHLMFIGLKKQLEQGETVKGVVDFKDAGKIEVEFKVGSIGAMSPPGSSDKSGSATPMKMPMQH